MDCTTNFENEVATKDFLFGFRANVTFFIDVEKVHQNYDRIYFLIFRDPSKRSKHVKTCQGEQSMIITTSSEGQTVITSEENGQVTLQLEQSVINDLLLEPETTQIQIGKRQFIKARLPCGSSGIIKK